MLQLKPGQRLFSVACDGEYMVIRGAGESDLCCGGHGLVESAADIKSAVIAGHDQGGLIGKRYVDKTGDVELLCTRAGLGSLSIAGISMDVKEAQSLPSSD